METKTNQQPQAAGEAAHTPTQWTNSANPNGNNPDTRDELRDVNGDLIGWVVGPNSTKKAAFIVRACNSHAALVAAADSIDRTVSSGGKVLASQYAALRTALKLAQ